jgi:nitrite reductase/ring-hydroxylating ferredoxin subunit
LIKHSEILKKLEDESYQKVCSLDDLQDGRGKRFLIDDVEIALFKIDGKVHALSNICPHQHTALIFEGFLEDNCVVCPSHGWKFDIKTGKKPSGSNGLETYKVKLVSDDVYVKINQKKLNW